MQGEGTKEMLSNMCATDFASMWGLILCPSWDLVCCFQSVIGRPWFNRSCATEGFGREGPIAHHCWIVRGFLQLVKERVPIVRHLCAFPSPTHGHIVSFMKRGKVRAVKSGGKGECGVSRFAINGKVSSHVFNHNWLPFVRRVFHSCRIFLKFGK